jgi:hypothetical protein
MRIAIAMLLAALPAAQAPDLPVEQTKKNIKVLQGLPSSQLIPVMAFMANSLGVTCAHCHAQAWDSDEKPGKDAARKMIALQRDLNARYYAGKTMVTCNTCHQGRVSPAAVPDIANAGWNRVAVAAPSSLSIPTEDLLGRISKAPEGIASRTVHGVVERYNGRDEPKSAPFILKIDVEKVQYTTELSHPPEATRALLTFLLTPPPIEKVRDEQWKFDEKTGALLSRSRELPTPLGILPERIDYADYRAAGGANLPFFARWSRADYRVTFTIQDVESGGALRQ